MKTAQRIAAALTECQARPDLVERARLHLDTFSRDVRAIIASRPGGPALCRAVEEQRVLFLARLTELLHPMNVEADENKGGDGV